MGEASKSWEIPHFIDGGRRNRNGKSKPKTFRHSKKQFTEKSRVWIWSDHGGGF